MFAPIGEDMSDGGGSSDDFLNTEQRNKQRKKELRKKRQAQIGAAKHARVRRDWQKLRVWKRDEQSDEVIEEELHDALVQERGKVDVSGLIIFQLKNDRQFSQLHHCRQTCGLLLRHDS